VSAWLAPPNDQQSPEMPGLLLVLGRIHDRARFAAYVQALPAIYAAFGGRYVALAPASEVAVLGTQSDRFAAASVVISVWNSIASLQSFWHSDAYRQAAALRAGTGEFLVAAIAANIARADLFAQAQRARHLRLALDQATALGAKLPTTIAHGLVQRLEGDFPAPAVHLYWQDQSSDMTCGSAVELGFNALPA
jgi:uncharacterized protein (DUF1330 family)